MKQIWRMLEGSKLLSKENGAIKVPEEKQKDNFGSGKLFGSTNDIKSTVLTDDDKKAISAGEDVDIWVEVKDSSSTVSQSDKTAVENKMPENYKVGAYLDINLWKQITGSAATKVTKLPNGKATTSPKTCDTNDVWFWSHLMIVSLGIFGYTMLYGKKNSEERR